MDDMEESELSKGFVRQRRNLIGVSVILFFYQYLKIVISKISIFGSEMLVGESSRMMYVLWFVWIYLFLRYYQFYRQVAHDNFHELIESRMRDFYVPGTALAKFKRSYIPEKDAANIPQFYKISLDKTSVPIVSASPTMWHAKAFINISSQGEHSGSSSIEEHDIFLDRYDLYKMKLRAFIYIAIHTSYATEYYLPFLIGLAPVAYFCFT